MSTKPEDSEALFNTSFNTFFEAATGHNPFPYQARLAREPWPVLIDVPTGLGKTAAVLMAWLWKRLAGDADTGRRLVYCLPMRSLVEQTAEVARAMCTALGPRFAEADRRMPAVAVLMGGAASGDWEREPARDQILVGTQDMLISRALNRGYAMSRFRWPVAFGLLNSDCMWVFDETQLMGVGVETSAQLQAFRDTLGTVGPTRSVWMSATLGQGQLCTVDHRAPADGWTSLTLGDADRDIAAARRRLDAPKQLAPAAHTLGAKNETAYCEAVAARAVEHCQTRGGLTLVVVNRVSRAQAIYRAARAANGELAMALIHSRFRPVDRRAHEAVLFGQGNESPAEDRLVIATQAIEAGVDVSARTLMTELAPWSSLVQRMGRCNRYGTEDDAVVEWLDIETGAKLDGLALPYDMAELDDARHKLGAITDAGPAALSAVKHEAPPRVRPILRRRDLLQLFDTTPDLAGADTDVSRFVRDGADTDVQFFWRAATSDNASDNEIDNSANSTPSRDELCRVSLGGAADFLTRLSKKRASAASKGAVGFRC